MESSEMGAEKWLSRRCGPEIAKRAAWIVVLFLTGAVSAQVDGVIHFYPYMYGVVIGLALSYFVEPPTSER